MSYLNGKYNDLCFVKLFVINFIYIITWLVTKPWSNLLKENMLELIEETKSKIDSLIEAIQKDANQINIIIDHVQYYCNIL